MGGYGFQVVFGGFGVVFECYWGGFGVLFRWLSGGDVVIAIRLRYDEGQEFG